MRENLTSSSYGEGLETDRGLTRYRASPLPDIQLALQVEAIPEEDPVEIVAPEGPDEPLDEGVRAGYERN